MKKLAISMIVAMLAATGNAVVVINVNFYASNGGYQAPEDPSTLEGPLGGLGETWNQFNTTSGSNLLDSTGAVTSVGYTNNVGTGWGTTNASVTLTALKSSRAHFGKGNDTTHTITGLTAGALYHIWVASYNHNSTLGERALGEWSTSNPTSTDGPQMIDSRFTGLNASTWEYGVNYVLFENVEADVNGQIVLLGDACDAGDYGDTYATRLHLNLIQIEEVDTTFPSVDAGSDWVTWSGEPVTLDDASAVSNDPGAGSLTLLWTADAPAGVTVDISNDAIEQPTITVTKSAPTDDVTVVSLTLTATQAGKEPVQDTMTIDVYDTSCKAAVGTGNHTITPGDINVNCVTDIQDLLEIVQVWLVDFTLTGAVDK